MSSVTLPVLLLRSSVAGRVPPANLMQYGQLAINLADRKIFSLTADGQTVVQLSVSPDDLAQVAFTGKFTDLTDAPAFSQYVLPISKSDALGGVMIGQGLTIDAQGKIAAAVQSVAGRTGVVALQGLDVGIPNDLMDANTTIKLEYIPSSILGGMAYKSSYKIAGPALAAPAPENTGWLYVASEAGTVTLTGDAEPVTLRVGDWLISNGTQWEIIPDVSGVITSVNEQTGDVVITLASLGAAVVAQTGSYSDLLNIPTDFVPKAHTHVPSDIIGLARVAETNDFNDLDNVPQGFAVANVSVGVSAEQFLTQDISYLFTRPAEFLPNFTSSVCVAELTGASTSSVIIQKNGEQIGTITIDGTIGTFSAVGVQTFAIGDKLTYHWNTLNIKSISINLQGTWVTPGP